MKNEVVRTLGRNGDSEKAVPCRFNNLEREFIEFLLKSKKLCYDTELFRLR